MLSIDDYCDLALNRQGLTSDRALSKALGFRGPSVTHWRTKRSLPSDETMIKLADLAGVDRGKALFDLWHWTAKTPQVREVIDSVRKKIAVAVFFICSTCFLASGETDALELSANKSTSALPEVYIMRELS